MNALQPVADLFWVVCMLPISHHMFFQLMVMWLLSFCSQAI